MGHKEFRNRTREDIMTIEDIIQMRKEIKAKTSGPLYQIVLWEWLKLIHNSKQVVLNP